MYLLIYFFPPPAPSPPPPLGSSSASRRRVLPPGIAAESCRRPDIINRNKAVTLKKRKNEQPQVGPKIYKDKLGCISI